ncbi:1262_t:CDS:2, partial [Racocetra persica]
MSITLISGVILGFNFAAAIVFRIVILWEETKRIKGATCCDDNGYCEGDLPICCSSTCMPSQ